MQESRHEICSLINKDLHWDSYSSEQLNELLGHPSGLDAGHCHCLRILVSVIADDQYEPVSSARLWPGSHYIHGNPLESFSMMGIGTSWALVGHLAAFL